MVTPMRSSLRALLAPAMLAATLALSGCQSSEEKAEAYYQSGLALLAAGDEERALIEFRNVFEYNGFHKEARKAYADLQRKRGKLSDAYGQYLRLVEQYPDTPEVRRILAEMAIDGGNWEEAERHGREAVRLDPKGAGIEAIRIALDYRKAALADDADTRAALAAEARKILEADPESGLSRRVVIDQALSGANPVDALPDVEAAIAQNPTDEAYQLLKLQLLAQKNDIPAMGVQLKAMVKLFPENEQVRSALIAWYVAQKDMAGAEAFLRELAGAATGPAEGHLTVVQFLQAANGAEAAQAELKTLIAANAGTANAELYRALDAGIDFAEGRQPQALAAFEDILKTAAPSDQTNRIKIMYAGALIATGNPVGARAQVEEVIKADPSHVQALQMRAAWLIQEDKPGEAILDLRTALDQEPRNSRTLMLMAEAHERDGNPELAGERLALAVEASGKGAEESFAYAQFLLRGEKAEVAEKVLIDALQVAPADVRMLGLLARIRLERKDFSGVQGVIDQLRALPGEEPAQTAQELQAALIAAQGSVDDSLSFLQGIIDKGDTSTGTLALMLRTQLQAGQTAEARKLLDDALAKAPQDRDLRLMSASLHGLMNETEAAETTLRALLAENAADERAAQMLFGLLKSKGRADEAKAVLDAALTATPTSASLRWLKAGDLEKAGDIDGALAIYEAMYAEDSGNVVVANNLASLLAAHKADAASLDRAFAVARRLRGLEVPAFQDTYGWILYRRGDLAEAVKNLEPAAKGLPDDPMVQVHLGLAYADLGRTEEARTQLTHALDLAGDSPLPAFEEARKRLAALPPAAAPAPEAANTSP